ncbi:MAG: hypothetical protein ACTHLW_06315 [Verrucomicrobiota bacterium]
MRVTTVLCLTLLSVLSVALADDALDTFPKVSVTLSNDFAASSNAPTLELAPGDVVQESITIRRASTNIIAVMWTYTEAGAQKALDFWDAHPSPYTRPSEKWRAGWLKSRTDKCIFNTEDAAKRFMAELKLKTTKA